MEQIRIGDDELNYKVKQEDRNHEIEGFEEVDEENVGEELEERIENELTPFNKENRSNEVKDEEDDEKEEMEKQTGNELILLDGGENKNNGEIGTKSTTVLLRDLEEKGESNEMRRETLAQNKDMTLPTYNASVGKDNSETNPSAVEVEDADIQTLPASVVEDVKISPRLHVSRIRTRDPSTSAELDGANKRQKIKTCLYYAKGWCIKGVLCRFPHVKEGLDATVRKNEGTSAITCHGKGFDEIAKPFENTNNCGSQKPFDRNLGASRFTYRESGSYSRSPIFKDPNDSNTSFSDWEPSIPFRPSHHITINLLSNCLHNPLRDSTAQTNVRDELGNASNFVKGSPTMQVSMQSNNSEEKNQGNLKHRERALKQFQLVLVEHVKELLKATWHEGRMSKDAHKLIVKKSVDKILCSLQHEEVPITSKQIKSYFSHSQSKIAKLVEAYIEKHGKS